MAELLTRREWRERALQSEGIGLGSASALVEVEARREAALDWDSEKHTPAQWVAIRDERERRRGWRHG